MPRLKIKLNKYRTIQSSVKDVTSDYNKTIVYRTSKEIPYPKKDKVRDIFRKAFANYKSSDNQIILDEYLVTISSNMTNYSIDKLKEDIRSINKVLNKKILLKYNFIKKKRHYKKSKDRIVFFTFFEQSIEKELTHCHIIMRVPISFKTKQKIDEIIEVINEYLPLKFSIKLTKRNRRVIINYITKKTSTNNDNFEVF